jgi:multiple sugar transport system substrate-binding protein
MFKKILIVALSLFATFGLIGCNNDTPETLTLEFWHNYSASDGQVAVLETLIDEFEAAHEGVTIHPVYMEWSALKDSVTLGAQTGVLPDILRGDIAFVPQFQSLNVLLNVSEFEDYEEAAAKVLAAPNSSNRMGTEYYGIAANTNTKILFYNKTLLENAEVSVPTTLAEVWTAAQTLTADGKIGYVEPWTGIWNVGPYIWSNGGDVLSPDNTTATGYINSSIVVDVITTLKNLYAAGALAGPSMDPGAVGDTDGWALGLYAMELDGPWRGASNAAAGVDYEAIPLPAGSAGSVSVLGGENFMLFQASATAKQEAAWEFVKFMTEKHAQVEMAKVGQMPVNIEALADAEAIAAMPLLPVFAEALATAKARPVIAQWSEIENVIATKVALAITGQKDVQVALDECAQEINAILAD